MAPHLLRAWSTYKDIWSCLFFNTQTHTTSMGEHAPLTLQTMGDHTPLTLQNIGELPPLTLQTMGEPAPLRHQQ